MLCFLYSEKSFFEALLHDKCQFVLVLQNSEMSFKNKTKIKINAYSYFAQSLNSKATFLVSAKEPATYGRPLQRKPRNKSNSVVCGQWLSMRWTYTQSSCIGKSVSFSAFPTGDNVFIMLSRINRPPNPVTLQYSYWITRTLMSHNKTYYWLLDFQTNIYMCKMWKKSSF